MKWVVKFHGFEVWFDGIGSQRTLAVLVEEGRGSEFWVKEAAASAAAACRLAGVGLEIFGKGLKAHAL